MPRGLMIDSRKETMEKPENSQFHGKFNNNLFYAKRGCRFIPNFPLLFLLQYFLGGADANSINQYSYSLY